MQLAGNASPFILLCQDQTAEQLRALLFDILSLLDFAAKRLIRFQEFGGALSNTVLQLVMRTPERLLSTCALRDVPGDL